MQLERRERPVLSDQAPTIFHWLHTILISIHSTYPVSSRIHSRYCRALVLSSTTFCYYSALPPRCRESCRYARATGTTRTGYILFLNVVTTIYNPQIRIRIRTDSPRKSIPFRLLDTRRCRSRNVLRRRYFFVIFFSFITAFFFITIDLLANYLLRFDGKENAIFRRRRSRDYTVSEFL